MAWRYYTDQLEAQLKYIKWVAAGERQGLDQFNRMRREEQAKSQLLIHQLENSYEDLTERIIRLRHSCHLLRDETQHVQHESS
jgi:hypothetical protein